ncbi:hypothetical protein FSP39_018230 [Pinctada imbricata]|uniref:Uncharacterized protein n=1 Tax=Pinctada imbricata TaxID=66713 RepID=A0AA88Y3X9_PINIB|nr:hypothetical protein FSP39_018230 [Pinctada imbricata]
MDQRIYSLHVDLRVTLATDWIVGGDADRFRMESRRYLKTPAQMMYNTPEQIFDELERIGLLGPGNYNVLRELTRNLHVEIQDIISEFERKMGINQQN